MPPDLDSGIRDTCISLHARENRGFVSLQSSGGGKILPNFTPPLKIFQLQFVDVEYDSTNLLEGAQEHLWAS